MTKQEAVVIETYTGICLQGMTENLHTNTQKNF